MQEEAAYKLLKVVKQQFGKGGVPYIATHDGRTIRYPDPDIKVCKCHIKCPTSCKPLPFMLLPAALGLLGHHALHADCNHAPMLQP